jgi:hypothetical protein
VQLLVAPDGTPLFDGSLINLLRIEARLTGSSPLDPAARGADQVDRRRPARRPNHRFDHRGPEILLGHDLVACPSVVSTSSTSMGSVFCGRLGTVSLTGGLMAGPLSPQNPGRPASLTDSFSQTWANSVQYDVAGRMTSMQYPGSVGSVTEAMSYNANGQLTSKSWSGGGLSGGLSYSYSATQNNGQIRGLCCFDVIPNFLR